MLIKCPHCGTRPVEEFTFLGDASPRRPTSEDLEAWLEYVYLRDNPRGAIDEYAQHSGGCRAWLVVMRDTASHEVQGVATAREYAKRRGP